jgi:hypothetical protein
VPQDDKRFDDFVQKLEALVAERCGEDADFAVCSAAARAVVAQALWVHEDRRLRQMATTTPRIEVDGEPYRRLSQHSSVIVHGLHGSHEIEEPLYRRAGVHDGPTIKPLVKRLGLVDGCMLPDLASAAGALMGCMTSREVEAALVRLGLRSPSRAVVERHVGDMLDEMATDVRSLEDAAREREQELDFEVAAVSCGMDRMSVRMDELLPDGPERDAKLRARAKRIYQRRPPEPHQSAWRMAWTGSVTLYDDEGKARRTLRYGAPHDDDAEVLAARIVDDVIAVVQSHPRATVICIQDGARDLDVLRGRLRECLPEGIRRCHVVDFHHAVSYLDAVVAVCEPPSDPDGMRDWYRAKLLFDKHGVDDILRQLSRTRDKHPPSSPQHEALDAAIRYCDARRPLMHYAELHAQGLPIGSGATESGCALFQLRIKRPGSHWSSPGVDGGLRGVMAARGLSLSDRWDSAFDAYHQTLRSEVCSA